MIAKLTAPQRALDQWAQDTGYSNFETYLATGGTMLGARRDLEYRSKRIAIALMALGQYGGPTPVNVCTPPGPVEEEGYPGSLVPPTVGPEALARLEAETSGAPEPVDPHNAHAQGVEHAC